MMFLKKINDYDIPNSGHCGNLNAGTWCFKVGSQACGFLLLDFSEASVIMSTYNTGYNIIQAYNHTGQDIQFKYANSNNGIYINIDKAVDYAYLGMKLQDSPTKTTDSPTTWREITLPANSSSTLAPIYVGTNATPPANAMPGSIYIYTGDS